MLLCNIKSPVDGTAVRIHVAVLILVMNCVLLSALFGSYFSCKNIHAVSDTKFETVMSPCGGVTP
jgi:hypothetical protein